MIKDTILKDITNRHLNESNNTITKNHCDNCYNYKNSLKKNYKKGFNMPL